MLCAVKINTMKITNRELIKRHANCYCTYCLAGGHTKAELNKIKLNEYENEMKKRKIKTPTSDELEGVGSFNGIGSV